MISNCLQKEALSLSAQFLKHLFHIQPVELWNWFNIDVKRFTQGLEPDWFGHSGRITVEVKSL